MDACTDDSVLWDDSHGHCVDDGCFCEDGVKEGLSADGGYAEAVAVVGDSADDAF